jgi:hypothetical protein
MAPLLAKYAICQKWCDIAKDSRQSRRIREDGDERGMLIYGYKFRPVLKPI